MCVTNFFKRNPRPVAAAANPTAALSKAPSVISQRLHGSLLPMLANTPIAKPATIAAVNNNIYSSTSLHGSPMVIGNNYELPKQKPKRKRKPQKPGLTAKRNERHFVKHEYHDHAFDTEGSDLDEDHQDATGMSARKPCSTSQSFPMKLHSLLEHVEAEGLSHIISWQPHGRCFCIHKTQEFSEIVLPTYLRQAKLTSFQRQLNLYGFARLTRGKDAGGYYHELFLRGKGNLTKRMKRTKIKGTKFKAASSPDQEPDFYSMPPVTALAHVSDESSADNDSHRDGYSCSTMQMQPSSVVEFCSTSPYEPNSFQVPCQQIFHTPIQQQQQQQQFLMSSPAGCTSSIGMMAPLVSSSSAMKWEDVSISSTGMIGGYIAGAPSVVAPQPVSSTADHVLDDAVDELFRNTDSVSEDVVNLDDLWDPVSFGETDDVGRIENDLQLGSMLETFLEQY